MDTQPLLSFDPSELIFLFELNKQLSSSIKLLNKTQNHVAFKLLTTNPRNYVVRPRIGILLPGSVLEVTVTMRAVKEPPLNMRCKDRFMIQSAIASPDANNEDIRTMFNKETGHVFQEFKLRVVYSMLTQSSCEVSVTDDRNSNVSEIIDPVLGPRETDLQVTDPVVGPQDNDLQMSTRKLLDIQPPKLELPLIPEKETSCSIQLSNVSDNHVAFRVNTESPKYFIRPNIGILLPKSTCDITVRMKAQNKVSSDIQSEDKFLIQSVVAPAAATAEDVTLDMFDNATSPIEECELQVFSISKPEDNSDRIVEYILRGVITSLLGLVSWYLMKQTLSWIWSLTMLAMMLVIKMVKKLVSDSVEDWIVKTLLYIIMHFVFRRKDNIPLS